MVDRPQIQRTVTQETGERCRVDLAGVLVENGLTGRRGMVQSVGLGCVGIVVDGCDDLKTGLLQAQ